MAEREDDVEVLLEFFGIKLTTPNQHLAAVLKTDIGDILKKDMKELLGKVAARERDGAIATAPDPDDEPAG
ncbi:MAG: hypothetical protein C4521_05040 [Actinobacteria bacterium]|nr:MAG: hypothetical protein C4521_05040 [Actinomycetota bacterium]